MEVLLAVIVLFLAVITGVNLSIYFRFRFLQKQLVNFLTPVAEGELSPAGKVAGHLAATFAQAIVLETKNNLTGDRLAHQHMAKTVDNAVAADMLAAGNPELVAIIDQFFPTLKKKLIANPKLMAMVASKLAGYAGGRSGVAGNSPGGPGQKPVNLNIT